MRTVAWFTLLLISAPPAWAHAGDQPTPIAWTLDPWIVAPLLLFGAGYAAGAIRLWQRAGSGHGVRRWTVAAYIGWLSLAGALVSPLHALGETLFTFHMIEHEIVMAVSAPLLVLSRPAAVFLWALPRSIRIRMGRIIRHPAAVMIWRGLTLPRNATVLHGIAIWIWHVPVLFDAAVTETAVHRLQHLSFLLTALLFWWALVRRSDQGAAVWHLFATMIHTSILGALLALAPRVLYHAQTAHAADWGLTPLEDQQLAGVVMWVPAGTIYAGAALVFAALWITRSASRWRRNDALFR